MDMIESTIAKTEYLTSRQVVSCEKGDLVRRNLNLLPVRETATFCHPAKINLKIRMKIKNKRAISRPFVCDIAVVNLSPFESPSPYHGEGEIGGEVKKNQHPNQIRRWL
jgi:hypothetical protein